MNFNKIFGKIKLMIILIVSKKQSFTLFFRHGIF